MNVTTFVSANRTAPLLGANAARAASAAALLLTLVATIVPFMPNMPASGLDPSWQYAINAAVARGLTFGRDVIFTFGPYASMYTRSYDPATDALMLWGCLAWSLSFFALLVRLFRGTSSLWLLLMTVAILVLPYSPDALLFLFPFVTGLLTFKWASRSADSEPRAQRSIDAALLCVAYLMFGLLGLTKTSVLLALMPAALLSALALWTRRYRLMALAALILPNIGVVAFWAIAGQNIGSLPSFVVSSVPIITGYSDAMSLAGNRLDVVVYAVAGCVIIFSLFGGRATRRLNICRAVLAAAILFLSFKAGFVRADGHVVRAGVFIALAGITASAALGGKMRYVVVPLSFVACIYIVYPYAQKSPDKITHGIAGTYVHAYSGMVGRMRYPDRLEKDFAVANATLRSESGIPRVDGSTDIYPWDQAGLIASGNKWSPRPVPQSYSAYTEHLEEVNRDHLSSNAGPRYVFFRVATIDGRLPSLEDGLSWPVLLSQFKPVGFASDHLVLKRNRSRRSSAAVTWATPREVEFDKWVPVPPTPTHLLFARINVGKTPVGRIVSLLYKAASITIHLQLVDGRQTQFRLIPGMASTGFMMSPLITSTKDFALMFGPADLLRAHRVRAFMITTASVGSFEWSRTASVRFATDVSVDRVDMHEVLRLQHLANMSMYKDQTTDACVGNIDVINGRRGDGFHGVLGPLLTLRGWLAASVANNLVPKDVYVTLTNLETGRVTFIATRRTARPDVNAFFHKPSLGDVGFSSSALLTALAPGQYVVGLAYVHGRELMMCRQFKTPGRVTGQ